MVSRYTTNSFIPEQEESDISPDHRGKSPPSASSNCHKTISSTSFSKKSKRAMQKRVVSIPIQEVEGSRLKGDTAPPSDSWSWRKYGQKPIKGSPYPRGYYRCSGSKGCPARKQVERSHVDPTTILVTYSAEHNHPFPTSSRNHHNSTNSNLEETNVETPKTEPDPEDKFSDFGEDSLITGELGWLADLESTSSAAMLHSPIFTENSDADVVKLIMKEEDESLFADLGELPECSVVFRRRRAEEEKSRQCTVASWCGTSS